MIVTQDERTAARFQARYPVEIEANGHPIVAHSVNVGIGGICLEPGAALPERTPVVCRVDAEGHPLEAQGEVAWQYAEDGVYRMGIRFCALSPGLAGWLSAVSTTHTAVAKSHEPLSDTQPMKVPFVAEAAEAAPIQDAAPEPLPVVEAMPAVATHAADQLDLWKKGAAAAGAAPIEDSDAVDQDVLFDDMPTPEARAMRSSNDESSIEAMSAKHRLAALAGKVRGQLARAGRAITQPLQKIRARRRSTERAATTARIPVPRASRDARSLASRLKVGALVSVFVALRAKVGARPFALLRDRRVRLGLAAFGVAALIGSALAFMFSGDEASTEPQAEVAGGAAPANDTGSYWDPPAIPVPDQEIAEAPPAPAPEPAPAPRPGRSARAAASAPAPEPVAIPDLPLPEPPMAEPEPSEAAAGDPEAIASADSDTAAPAEEATEQRSAQPTRAERRAARRAERRAERERAGRAERERRTARAERHGSRREASAAREEPRRAAPERHATAPARAEPARHESHASAARAEAHPAAHAAAAAAPGRSTFRLNLSGAPGAIHTYPLANPNGIVIDVANLQHPGEATKLTSDDPRIRFVKIINREQGVRFIVYLNGPLPQYQVEASGRGVRVALRD